MRCLYGTPNVTTDLGAEAMHGELPWSGEIANTAEDIAAAAVKLYFRRNFVGTIATKWDHDYK